MPECLPSAKLTLILPLTEFLNSICMMVSGGALLDETSSWSQMLAQSMITYQPIDALTESGAFGGAQARRLCLVQAFFVPFLQLSGAFWSAAIGITHFLLIVRRIPLDTIAKYNIVYHIVCWVCHLRGAKKHKKKSSLTLFDVLLGRACRCHLLRSA
jgi:hypothetical protein